MKSFYSKNCNQPNPAAHCNLNLKPIELPANEMLFFYRAYMRRDFSQAFLCFMGMLRKSRRDRKLRNQLFENMLLEILPLEIIISYFNHCNFIITTLMQREICSCCQLQKLMRKIYFVAFLLFYCIHAISQTQNNYGKLGATLKILIADKNPASPLITKHNGISYLPVLIEFNSKTLSAKTLSKKINIRTQMGNIATADIAINDIEQLLNFNEIDRIELPLFFRKTDTLMKKITTAFNVLKGMAPLDKSYTGKNTVMGIIDDGFDFTHPDFNTAENRSRFLSIWNMDYNNQPPAGFTYGHEWLPDSLEPYKQLFKSRQIGNYEMERLFGYSFHGTSVAGLAAGNNGIATGADLVGVALTAFGDTLLRSDRMLDAIKYIYEKAGAAKKKCIINISLGIMEGGPHDGKTLVEKAIDNFCDEKSDILICSSAGNNGNTWKHWGGVPINKDSSFFFFQCAYEGSLYFVIPKQYSSKLSLSFTDSKLGNPGNPNISRDSIIEQTSFVNIGSIINSQAPLVLQTKFPNNNLSSSFIFSASHYNNDYDELVVKVNEFTSTNNNFDFHLYRFIWKGEGTVHCWLPFWNLHPVYFFDRNPLPDDPTYLPSDNAYTTVIPSHAFTILSSGAYNIRTCFVHMNKEVVRQYEKCRTTYFTSHGPTQDGRIKPDIITPGDNVMAPRKRFDDFYGHQFIVDTNTVSFGGTSASSPITAGIAALVWEKFPLFTRSEVIEKIKSTASFDSYCRVWGPQPNNIAGMGKVDAFNAVGGVKIDNTELCNAYDECKVPIMPVDIIPVVLQDFFSVYPNPAGSFFYVRYHSIKRMNYNLFDCTGKLVATGYLPSTNYQVNTIQIPTATRSSSIYIFQLNDSKTVFTKKIMIDHHY